MTDRKTEEWADRYEFIRTPTKPGISASMNDNQG